MRTRDLEALRAAVSLGSVTAAARALGCSQPGLTRRLQRLEEELGVKLLERAAGGVRATEAGERALAAATDVLDAVARLRAAVAGGRSPLHGTVRLVASTTPADHLVPLLVARFTETQPAVRLEVATADSAAVPIALLERRADVGFAGHAARDDRLTQVPIATDEVVLAVPTTHRLAGAGTVPLSALAGERMIWREEGSGTQRCFYDAVVAAGLELPQLSSTVSLGSSQAVVAAVAAGLGIGVVSVRALAARADVVALRVRGLRVERPLWMLYETSRRRPPHVAAFVAAAAADGASSRR